MYQPLFNPHAAFCQFVLALGWVVYVVVAAVWPDQLSLAGGSFCHLISPLAATTPRAFIAAAPSLICPPPAVTLDAAAISALAIMVADAEALMAL